MYYQCCLFPRTKFANNFQEFCCVFSQESFPLKFVHDSQAKCWWTNGIASCIKNTCTHISLLYSPWCRTQTHRLALSHCLACFQSDRRSQPVFWYSTRPKLPPLLFLFLDLFEFSCHRSLMTSQQYSNIYCHRIVWNTQCSLTRTLSQQWQIFFASRNSKPLLCHSQTQAWSANKKWMFRCVLFQLDNGLPQQALDFQSFFEQRQRPVK